jgi:phosphoribosylaminoimidazolecarboxamide formyltransferase/IMP cyclohydrolase
MQKIRRALISVSDKTGIVEFAKFLSEYNVEIISTGGTSKTLRDAGLKVRDISNLTGFPEIMDGRVKTLHPLVHGGLLAVRDNKEHVEQMKDHAISEIDMVVVNLYPFEETVAKGAEFAEVIENIDIGGPSMIRSAAKNFKFVTVVVNPARYESVILEMKNMAGATSLELRQKLSAEAYSRTASYDGAISTWFNKQNGEFLPETMAISAKRKSLMRYGENPHQDAALYITDSKINSAANAKIIQGKELSYNNILDADSALELVSEFEDSAVVIVKHNNPCGVATGKNQKQTYLDALGCDPVSAFGGIFAFNRTLEKDTAEEISKLFAEVIIAPKFSAEALEVFESKKNLRLLEVGELSTKYQVPSTNIRTVAGGFLVQSKDDIVLNKEQLKVVTKRKPTDAEMADLIFAFTVCKHVKSNAIVYAKSGATIGIGAGQMSRVDSARVGAHKAKETNTNVENASGSVLASDAFFPFADGLEAAISEGCTAVIQPGGSMRDNEVIEAADKAGLAMVFTGIRHFKH